MEKFAYKAKTSKGETVKGIVEAKDERQAIKILREKNLLVVSLKLRGDGLFASLKPGILNRVSNADKVNFTRQLSTMITAGLPLTEALDILEVQSSSAMGTVIKEISQDVKAGDDLSSALARHPSVFDQVYISLIRAGEAAGVLDKILLRLADNLEKQKEFRSKVKGAMIYPAIIILGMIGVAALMVIVVIPKLSVLYEEFQAQLPLPTRILLGISKFVTTFWWLCLTILIGLTFGVRVLLKNPLFRKQFDRIIFKMPIIGNLRKKMILTEFTRTLGLLAGAGVLLVEALEIVRHSLGSPIFKDAVAEAKKEVERGLPLALALAHTEVFPPILPQMVSVGEETGKIDEVLAKVSAYFEQESEAAVKGLTTAIEPLIIIILGIGVGFLIISVIMPIYSLTSKF